MVDNDRVCNRKLVLRVHLVLASGEENFTSSGLHVTPFLENLFWRISSEHF